MCTLNYKDFLHLLNEWKSRKGKNLTVKRKIKRILKFYLRNSLNYYFFIIRSIKTNSVHVKTSSKLVTINNISKERSQGNSQTLAIILHVFYFDIFITIMEKIEKIDSDYILYISTYNPIFDDVCEFIRGKKANAIIVSYENVGRDIYPFTQIMQYVKENNHAYLIKLHTKKSPHRLSRGSMIRERMLADLLNQDNIDMCIRCMKKYPIGIVGPSDYTYKLGDKIGPNIKTLKKLSRQINYKSDFNNEFFVGGSMFFSTIEAVEPILELDLCIDMFESEPTSIDGTLAHAIERFFGIACSKQKLETVDLEFIHSLQKPNQAIKSTK